MDTVFGNRNEMYHIKSISNDKNGLLFEILNVDQIFGDNSIERQ